MGLFKRARLRGRLATWGNQPVIIRAAVTRDDRPLFVDDIAYLCVDMLDDEGHVTFEGVHVPLADVKFS